MLELIGFVIAGGVYQLDSNLSEQHQVQIAVDIRPMDKVGKLKSGMICAPAGSLKWQQIARENDQDIGLRVRQAILADDAKRKRSSTWAIRGRIVSASIKLCAPWKNLIGKPKGTGSISVRWSRVGEDANASFSAKTYVIALKLDGRDPRQDPEVISEAVVEAGRKFADENVFSGF